VLIIYNAYGIIYIERQIKNLTKKARLIKSLLKEILKITIILKAIYQIIAGL